MITGDTIVAISSASGPAARMIVRLSGPRAHALAGGVCHAALPTGTAAQRAQVALPGLAVSAWVYVFRGPRSYTGEDMVELHLPGNPLLVRLVLDELMRLGARPAEAGEFTARAYLNGRMDLAEAEGVAATIAARGQQELLAARQLLAGELSRRLRPLIEELASLLALVEAGIDFSDEGVTFLTGDEVNRRAAAIAASLGQLIAESARFDRLSHQPQLVLAGRPNAGKSTLLNALAGAPRAVVSPIAGTTRDVIWAEVALARGIIRLTDAAGLAEQVPDESDASPQAHIARQMHGHALAAIDAADAVLLVRDVTDARPPLVLPRVPDLVILSKADLLDSRPQSDEGIAVSAVTGLNLGLLRDRLDELAFGRMAEGAVLALSARHLQAIGEAQAALGRVPAAGGDELLAMELRLALDALGQIVGRVSPEDLLGRIFANFCIGK